MNNLFQKKYIKTPIVFLVIFSLLFQSIPLIRTKAARQEPIKVKYPDFCEVQVSSPEKLLPTEAFQQACYVLKQIYDTAANEVYLAERITASTRIWPEDASKTNEIQGESCFPMFNCKTTCLLSFPQLNYKIDIIDIIISIFGTGGIAVINNIIKVMGLVTGSGWFKTIMDIINIVNQVKTCLEGIGNIADSLNDTISGVNLLITTIGDINDRIADLQTKENFWDKLANFENSLTSSTEKVAEIAAEIDTINDKKVEKMVEEMADSLGWDREKLKLILQKADEIGLFFILYLFHEGIEPCDSHCQYRLLRSYDNVNSYYLAHNDIGVRKLIYILLNTPPWSDQSANLMKAINIKKEANKAKDDVQKEIAKRDEERKQRAIIAENFIYGLNEENDNGYFLIYLSKMTHTTPNQRDCGYKWCEIAHDALKQKIDNLASKLYEIENILKNFYDKNPGKFPNTTEIMCSLKDKIREAISKIDELNNEASYIDSIPKCPDNNRDCGSLFDVGCGLNAKVYDWWPRGIDGQARANLAATANALKDQLNDILKKIGDPEGDPEYNYLKSKQFTEKINDMLNIDKLLEEKDFDPIKFRDEELDKGFVGGVNDYYRDYIDTNKTKNKNIYNKLHEVIALLTNLRIFQEYMICVQVIGEDGKPIPCPQPPPDTKEQVIEKLKKLIPEKEKLSKLKEDYEKLLEDLWRGGGIEDITGKTVCQLKDDRDLENILEVSGIKNSLNSIVNKLSELNETINIDVNFDYVGERVASTIEQINGIKSGLNSKKDTFINKYNIQEDELNEMIKELDELIPKIKEFKQYLTDALAVLRGLGLLKDINDLYNAIAKVIKGTKGFIKGIKDTINCFKGIFTSTEQVNIGGQTFGVDWTKTYHCYPAKGVYNDWQGDFQGEIDCPAINDIFKRVGLDLNICEGETTKTTATTTAATTAAWHMGGKVCPDISSLVSELVSNYFAMTYGATLSGGGRTKGMLHQIINLKKQDPEIEKIEAKANEIIGSTAPLQIWSRILAGRAAKCFCGESYCKIASNIAKCFENDKFSDNTSVKDFLEKYEIIALLAGLNESVCGSLIEIIKGIGKWFDPNFNISDSYWQNYCLWPNFLYFVNGWNRYFDPLILDPFSSTNCLTTWFLFSPTVEGLAKKLEEEITK